ncbi:hypothetical protein G3I77_07550 [Streptomyces sp. D2-8]|uniref:hypothetical protein n=1 Tax=Streptomyces sp. D2-8 TaxID=2707767 RepID=UPI0020BFE096|nr:hypothetical protein [Streptomyces sp. D2-8]MCK8432904.1 hypothetical protein [Streptomyces sp. D2-8]
MTDATQTYTHAGLPGLMGLMTGDEKHGPAATSTLDVLWVLYDRVLRVSPEGRTDPGRDRFLLSKGHGPMAYYAVLAARGFVPVEWLPGFGSLLRHAVAAGDDKVYVRLSLQSNGRALPVDGWRFRTVREGRSGVVVAVGPMLDAVLAATEGLDVTVLYATTVRPFDGAALRRATEASGTDVVLVEPYLAGTSTAAANDALPDAPHRVLGLGVGRRELRRYGRLEEHVAAHGLDARSLRERIGGFVGAAARG